MARLTREQILSAKRGHEEVELADGGTVLVRGMKHAEAHELRKLKTVREQDAFMIATCLLEPEMTLDDVDAWFDVEGSSGDLQRISAAISKLSGLVPGQGKDATKSVPRGRGRRRA